MGEGEIGGTWTTLRVEHTPYESLVCSITTEPDDSLAASWLTVFISLLSLLGWLSADLNVTRVFDSYIQA